MMMVSIIIIVVVGIIILRADDIRFSQLFISMANENRSYTLLPAHSTNVQFRATKARKSNKSKLISNHINANGSF